MTELSRLIILSGCEDVYFGDIALRARAALKYAGAYKLKEMMMSHQRCLFFLIAPLPLEISTKLLFWSSS